MSEQSQDNPGTFEHSAGAQTELTGRDRLISNVLFSWSAHFVFIVAGFIVPRMIDRRLGEDLLGIWDFAWSLVTYFGLLTVGISSSVNRYVARYRIVADFANLNRVVSSACCILGITGLLAFGLTLGISWSLPQLFGEQLGDGVHEAQSVVFFLGSSLAVQIAFTAFTGVLTGCHRWAIHNIIRSGWHAATVVAMVVALLRGGSLTSLAVITFAGILLAYLTRIVMAYRVCKGLRLRPSMVERAVIGRLIFFGGKTLLPGISKMLLYQMTSILIIAYLSPAALAVYTRPRAIVNHMNTLVAKMAMTLAPTASSLQSAGDLKDVRQLLTKAVSYSLYLVLPMLLMLIVFGDVILGLWMGPRYANALIPAVLAIGHIAGMAQLPALNVLIGLNAHARPGIALLVVSICSVGLAVLLLGPFGCGLVGAAVAVTLPLTILNLTYLPLLICRRFGLKIRWYFLSVASGPAVRVLPFAISLVAARIILSDRPLMGLICGWAVGSTFLAVSYWRDVLPDRLKRRVLCFVGCA
ncbi:MAG: oligosaccharide flippase family protein [Planctomycetota bacterium]